MVKKQEETKQQELAAKAAEFRALQSQAETVSFFMSQIIHVLCISFSWTLYYRKRHLLNTYALL